MFGLSKHGYNRHFYGKSNMAFLHYYLHKQCAAVLAPGCCFVNKQTNKQIQQKHNKSKLWAWQKNTANNSQKFAACSRNHEQMKNLVALHNKLSRAINRSARSCLQFCDCNATAPGKICNCVTRMYAIFVSVIRREHRTFSVQHNI